MTARHQIGPHGRVRRVMGVVDLVEWAFRDECAQLELPSRVDAEFRPRGYGLEFVLIQRAMLGTQIDGGGRSVPAHDADVVAAVVANISEAVGGRRMAAAIAEMARAGLRPDWMPDATPRVVPQDWRQTKHGMFAKTEVIERISYRKGRRGGGRMVHRDVTWCPITITPTAQQIAAARRFYLQWWSAMLEIKVGIEAAEGMMDRHVVSDELPPVAPWNRRTG